VPVSLVRAVTHALVQFVGFWCLPVDTHTKNDSTYTDKKKEGEQSIHRDVVVTLWGVGGRGENMTARCPV
jgi:hypothetical protein